MPIVPNIGKQPATPASKFQIKDHSVWWLGRFMAVAQLIKTVPAAEIVKRLEQVRQDYDDYVEITGRPKTNLTNNTTTKQEKHHGQEG